MIFTDLQSRTSSLH